MTLVSPVIDKKMMSLSQLVKGQKRVKKKSKKSSFSGSFNSRSKSISQRPFSTNYINNNNNSFQNRNKPVCSVRISKKKFLQHF